MKTREWTFVDRGGWPSGEWDGEPDKRQWVDDATGLPCLIRRNRMGALCGYVAVGAGHPWYGVGYSDGPDEVVDVHGGLTFAGACDGDEEGICHVVEAGESDAVWWFGFDCAHYRDTMPIELKYGWSSTGEYRNFAYVAGECARLAAQLA